MPPKFGDLKRYCDRNRWVLVRDTDHWYYERVLNDGTVLRTKVSHAISKEIPKNLWERILRKQLHINEQDFWKGLK